MSELSADRIDEIVDCIARDRDGDISLVELLSLSKLMIESLRSLIASHDEELGGEVASIARHIDRTRIELGRLAGREITEAALPDADDDLHEVARSTECATEAILASAERIMSADAADVEAYRRTVDDAVVSIFEACCFQDLTGQRIRRVVDTLSYVNQHVGQVMDVIGGSSDNPEAALSVRIGKGLMNGPQPAGEAITQDDADAVFGPPVSNVVKFRK